jgi:phosphatidylserine decarboxylase
VKKGEILGVALVCGMCLIGPGRRAEAQTIERDTTITGPRGRTVQRDVEIQRGPGSIDRSVTIKRPGGTYERQTEIMRTPMARRGPIPGPWPRPPWIGPRPLLVAPAAVPAVGLGVVAAPFMNFSFGGGGGGMGFGGGMGGGGMPGGGGPGGPHPPPPPDQVALECQRLQSMFAGTRKEAAYNLGRMSDPRAVPSLVHALKYDNFKDVRVASAIALGEIGGSDAAVALERSSIYDHREDVRKASTTALDRLNTKAQAQAARMQQQAVATPPGHGRGPTAQPPSRRPRRRSATATRPTGRIRDRPRRRPRARRASSRPHRRRRRLPPGAPAARILEPGSRACRRPARARRHAACVGPEDPGATGESGPGRAPAGRDRDESPRTGEAAMDHRPAGHQRHRVGRWLPHQDDLEDWLEGLVRDVKARAERGPLHPAVEGFRDLIDRDPIVRMLVTQMIEQVPHTRRYRQRHLQSVGQMLLLIDEVIGRAPEYNETGLVGCPLNAVLDWCMGTTAGFAAFRHPPINAMFRKILRAWRDFLSSPASLYVINDSPRGWKCASAKKSTRIEEFQHKPREKHWGFASWNDYFTRRFKPGARPIADPDDDKVIVNACESTPYAIKTNVRRQDRFWIKAQPYSLQDMLAGDESVDAFVGGSVFQSFLDAHNYHRWHSPVSGTVRKATVLEGTYFSEAESEGEDPEGPNRSQGYLAHVATRALILIEADDPAIGLVGFMAIGMAEVSSCVIHPEVAPGRRLKKGDEVGFFQFGGSTYCLIFRPGALAGFAVEAMPQPDHPGPPLVLLGTRIATASG